MNITEFLNRKYLERQLEVGRRITIEEFAKQFGASKGLMTMWLNGKRNPGTKYKEKIIKFYGEEAVIAFGDDPDLYTIEEAWQYLFPQEKQKFKKAIVKAAAENFNSGELPPSS